MSEEIKTTELQAEQVPDIITDEYLKKVALQKAEDFIKEYRSQGNYLLANDFVYLLNVIENLHYQLKNEEKKSEELREQQIDATGRIEEALKISQNDRDLIIKLQQEVKTAWKEADASKLREENANELFYVTQEKYTSLMDKMKNKSVNVESSDELGEHKETVLHQCERLTVQMDELNKRLFVQRAYTDELQSKLDDALEKNRDLFRQWDMATNEAFSNKNAAEKLQKSLNEMNEDYNKVTQSLVHFKETNEYQHRRLIERDRLVKDLNDKLDKFKGEFSLLNAAKSKCDLTIKSYKSEFYNIKHDMNRFEAYVRLKDEENRKLIAERDREIKKVENLVRKISSIENVVNMQEQEIISKKNEIDTAEKERDMIKKSNDKMRRENNNLKQNIDQMVRETERLNALISTFKQEKQKLMEEQIHINNALKATIEREKKSNSNVKKLQANIEIVESEKLYLDEQIKQLNEDIDARKKQYERIKSELNESNQQIAYYKHEYNLSIKNLKDTRADFQKCHEKESDIKDRLMKFKGQMEDISEKLAAKILENTSLKHKIKRLEKKYRVLIRDFEKSEDALRLCRIQSKNSNDENKLLKEEIRENHSRFTKMKNQADKILRERDLVATQMYRKVDENSLLEDQVSMLKMSIERGSAMYNERMEDIKAMKNEIQSLRSQSNLLKRGLENTMDMRQEVMQLHRKLNQERTKAKALEDEMKTPANVHRWRKLSWRDPNRMELIRKCHRLQRNCLKQTARNVKAEELIKILEEKVENLEKQVNKRQSLEASEKLLVTRSQLQMNTKRMKAALAISRATKSDLNLKDNAINQLEKEINELKSQFFNEKRANQKLIQKLRKNSENLLEEKEVGKKMKNLGNAFKRELLT